jgi:DNA mismatch endonuclease, patch repair protein
MAAIRGADTKPELLVRRTLHARGFRFRLHVKDLPGRPDLVLPKHKAVVFVHGCFWHGHDCNLFRLPATRTAFWEEKIAANQARDRKANAALALSGWRIGEIFECALKGPERLPQEDVASRLTQWLRGDAPAVVFRGSSGQKHRRQSTRGEL